MLDDIYFRLLVELVPEKHRQISMRHKRIAEQSGDAAVARELYSNLVNQVYKDDADSDIGIRYGEHLRPHALCDLSRALMSADNFSAFLKAANRFHSMLGASYFLVAVEKDKTIALALTYPFKDQVSEPQRRFCAEAAFSYIINLLQESIGQDIAPKALYLNYEAPKYAETYLERFNNPGTFNSPISVIEFDKTILSLPFKAANPTLHQLYMNKCNDTLWAIERSWDFEYRVVTYLMQYHPVCFSGQTLASRLNISVRGLQKRLSKNGESFSSLASKTRRELASVYLMLEGADIDTTAERLGFQTSSGFRRFFKNEFEMTLPQFLAQMPKPVITPHKLTPEKKFERYLATLDA